MTRKGDNYTDEQLTKIYRRYAELKGWNTSDEVVQDKLQSWRAMSIGPVGLAIDFHETGKDNAKHLGRDAEIEAGKAEGGSSLGCTAVFVALIVTIGGLLAVSLSLLAKSETMEQKTGSDPVFAGGPVLEPGRP